MSLNYIIWTASVNLSAVDGQSPRMYWQHLPRPIDVQTVSGYGCNKISAAITETHSGEQLVKVVLDPYNMEGSSIHVNFTTSNPRRYETMNITAY